MEATGSEKTRKHCRDDEQIGERQEITNREVCSEN
jgi:hypothetical protein